jgi:hypothetical protein
MEFGGALESLREFELAETAGDVAERRGGRKRLCAGIWNDGKSDGLTVKGEDVDWRLDGGVCGLPRVVGGGGSGLIFLGFELGAIFRSEDLGALEIFFGVNVLGFFLLRLFASAFLLGRFGDILSVALRDADHGAGEN